MESLTQSDSGGRYDILFAAPGETLELASEGVLYLDGSVVEDTFLNALDRRWAVGKKPEDTDTGFPFCGGWFLYLAYELSGEIEPTLRLDNGRDGWPIALAVYCSAAIIRDRATGEVCAVSNAEDTGQLSELVNRARHHADSGEQAPTAVAVRNLREENPEPFLDGVSRIKSYILDGDVFQVNFSRGWEAELSPGSRPLDLYRALRQTNPSPFACSAIWNHRTLASSSPERLIRRRGPRLDTRPIAGTRPRAKETPALDQSMYREMLGNAKERAEHIMLVDLERNDLGRVSRPGTVNVDELMAVESYAHVHHIVSNITGQALPGMTPGKMVSAMFPGGTITGAPKVRCMEIIAELEQVGRGAYTGSAGYLSVNGHMDLNILIRTMVESANHVRFRAGAGIVADSDPVAELEETRSKARGLLRALQEEY